MSEAEAGTEIEIAAMMTERQQQFFHDFLANYAKYLRWRVQRDPKAVAERLCREAYFFPEDPRQTLRHVCFGWIWGQTGDHEFAKETSFEIKAEMTRIYQRIKPDGPTLNDRQKLLEKDIHATDRNA